MKRRKTPREFPHFCHSYQCGTEIPDDCLLCSAHLHMLDCELMAEVMSFVPAGKHWLDMHGRDTESILKRCREPIATATAEMLR